MHRVTLRESCRAWFSQGNRPVGPVWLHHVWTLAFSVFVAAMLTVFAIAFGGHAGDAPSIAIWWHTFRAYAVVSVCIGFAIQWLFDGARWLAGGRERIERFGLAARVLFFAGIPIVGVVIGWPLGMLVLGEPVGELLEGHPSILLNSVLVSLVITFVFYQVFAARARQTQAERRATEAQLKLLQGQIEPHFLFNTLANVVGLMDRDAPRAKLMLESFIDYLRSSFGGLRHAERHTLGDELALVEAYLRVIGIRMDDRLRWRIDVPEALRALPLPALTLQPLVENAIVHGLEPQVDGGTVTVAAALEGGRLRVTVQDDGLGLGAARARRSNGSGTACRNIRERLLQSHGPAADLRIDGIEPHGVRATLVLPLARPLASP